MKKNNIFFTLLLVYVLFSCQSNEIKYSSVLFATDDYLSFPIDDETRLPYSVLTFKNEDREYLSFSNDWKENLFYTLDEGNLVKKVKFNTEGGSDNIHQIYGYSVLDFNNICVSNSVKQICYTDTTGRVNKRIDINAGLDKGYYLYSFNSPLIIDNNIYLSQEINPRLGENYMGKSPLGIMFDTSSKKVIKTPLRYFPLYTNEELVTSTHGGLNYFCFDGNRFVYSYDTSDSLYTLDKSFQKVETFLAKSQYIDQVTPESNKNWDFNGHLRAICESPSYGNILYDKYRQVYYRFAYPKVELEKHGFKEGDNLEIKVRKDEIKIRKI